MRCPAPSCGQPCSIEGKANNKTMVEIIRAPGGHANKRTLEPWINHQSISMDQQHQNLWYSSCSSTNHFWLHGLRTTNRRLTFHPKIRREMFEQSCRFGSGPQFSRLFSVLMWNPLVRSALIRRYAQSSFAACYSLTRRNDDLEAKGVGWRTDFPQLHCYFQHSR